MEEIRGVWIANQPHSKVLKTHSNIVEALDFLQTYGFNLIFPVVWNRGYTLYPSEVMNKYYLPTIDPAYQERDPLAEIIIEAHKHNIKVIPWLEYGFAASNLPNGGHILQQYPQWQGMNKEGEQIRHSGLTWMNAFNAEVQQFMLEIITEIVSNYNIDGIQGCDRLPASPVNSGYDPETVANYLTAFGKQPPSNPQEKQWVKWRANKLTDFLAKLYYQVKTIKSQTIVSLSPAIYPFCLVNLLQDYPTWIEQGLVDIIHPQIYRSNFFRYNQEIKKISKAFNHDTLAKFAPGIAFTANGTNMTIQDLAKCIKKNRDRNLAGQVFFHYEGLRKNNDAMAIALFNSAAQS